jgi:asparagine synthase (glutamine-hydrolysing)
MCGISGAVAGRGDADVAAVQRMNARLVHRGPDSGGIWQSGRGVLGHRRLAIVDLSAEANQPLLNEDRTIGVVVNGEIYNAAELRGRLEDRGHHFVSRSDSEVVVHAYEEYGAGCIARLVGMFSLAIWDSTAERLLLARDRAGKKPLFYRSLPGGGLAFASEVQALRAGFPELSVTPDLGVIDEYLTLQYVPSPRCIYQEIAKLEAAHLLVLEGGVITKTRYWSLPVADELEGSEEDHARTLRSLLETAVRRRMVSDVPVGAFLSGGLDSSAVVGLMATQSTRRVKTFSLGFGDAQHSELPWARLVAERHGTDHHEAVVTTAIRDVVEGSVRRHGEPFADSSSVAAFALAELTKAHVTVALSGDAADEAFGGYTRYATARLGHVYDRLPSPARSVFRRGSLAVTKRWAPHVNGFMEHYSDGEAARYPYIMCQFNPEEKLALYSPAMRAAMSDATQSRFRRVLAASTRRSALGRLLELDWNTYLVDDINVKVDISSMANALEVRCPFLDNDVVEFAARVPLHMLGLLRGKRLLRRAVHDLVPGPIRRRRKRGFGLPLRKWLTGDLGGLAREVLLDRTARERGLFEQREVARLLGALATSHEAADRVWTLLMLELWFREFVDRSSAA